MEKITLLADLLQPSCAASLIRKLTEKVINGPLIFPQLSTYNGVRGIPAIKQMTVFHLCGYMDYGVIRTPKHVNSTLSWANGAVTIGNVEQDFAKVTNACQLVRWVAVQGIPIAPKARTVVLFEKNNFEGLLASKVAARGKTILIAPLAVDTRIVHTISPAHLSIRASGIVNGTHMGDVAGQVQTV